MPKYEVTVLVRLELEGVVEVDAADEEAAEAVVRARTDAGEFHPNDIQFTAPEMAECDLSNADVAIDGVECLTPKKRKKAK